MISERRLHDWRDLARLHGEDRLFELRYHLRLAEDAEIATALGGTGLVALGGQLGEIRRRGFGPDPLGLLLGSGLLFRRGIRVDLHQNVARGHGFARIETLFIGANLDRVPRLLVRVIELLDTHVLDVRPEGVVHRLFVRHGIPLRAGHADQLIVDPQFGDRTRHIFFQWRLRAAQDFGKSRDGELLRANLGGDVRIGRSATGNGESGGGKCRQTIRFHRVELRNRSE